MQYGGSQDRAPEQVAEVRARQGWAELRRHMRSIAPSDLLRLVLTGLAIGLVFWLVVASWPALLPFTVGGFIAYALLPIVNLLNRVLPRVLAALLTLASFFVVAAALAATLLPALVTQAMRLYEVSLNPVQLALWRAQLDSFLQAQEIPFSSLLRDYLGRTSLTMRAQLDAQLDALAAYSAASTFGLISTLGLLIGTLLLPLWMLALMISQPNARAALIALLPDWLEADVWAIVRIVDRVLRAFLGGRLLLALTTGPLFYLALTVLAELSGRQFRYSVLAALFVGVMQLIPQIGPLIALIVLAALSLATSLSTAVVYVGAYLLAQVVETVLITRRIERRMNDLNPVVLTLLIAALSRFGLIWVLLAAPMLAIARDLLRYAYGRTANPPRPAGLLPGEPLPLALVQVRSKRRLLRSVPAGRSELTLAVNDAPDRRVSHE